MFAGIESSLKDTSLTKQHVIMSELAERLSVALSSATGIVDRLVTKGYVSRSRSKADRRIVQVRLTEKGANLLADHDRRARLMVERMLSCLDEQEQEELIRMLEKVDNTLSEA
jgi:DNA-binding MarR family transcriptional regulator